MNRDEKDAARENITGIDIARTVALGVLPSSTLGDDAPRYVLDVQVAVDKAVSIATRNSRKWDRKTLYAAYKAARPIVESDLRQQGISFTRDEVKAAVRPRVSAYVSKYGVILPSGVRVGSTALASVAGDVCGAFHLPWTAFMPPQVQMVAKAAEAGNPKAQSWLKKLFSKTGPTAPPAPAPVPAPAPAPAPAAHAAPATKREAAPKPATEKTVDSSDLNGWTRSSPRWSVNPRSLNTSSYQNDGEGRRRRRRHHRHHRRDRDRQQAGQQYQQPYNPNLPVGPYNQPGQSAQPYNPSLPVGPYNQPPVERFPGANAAAAQYAATHGPSTVAPFNPYLPTYPQPFNPNLPISASNQPQPYNPALPLSPTNVPPLYPTTDQTSDESIYGIGSSDSLGAFMHKLNPLYWIKSSEERKLIDAERQAWIDNAAIQKKLGKREQVLESGKKALEAKQAVAVAQARSAELEAQLKAIETQVTGACAGDTSLGRSDIVGTIGPAEIVGDDLGAGANKPNPFSESIPEEDAAPVLKKVSKARQLNEDNRVALDPILAKLHAGRPLSPDESAQMLILLARNEQLHEFRKGLMSGEIYSKNPSAKKINRHVILGAVAAMTPTEQLMLSKIATLAKQGNPNAQKALAALKAQGYAVTMGQAGPVAQIPGKPMTPAEQKKLAAIVALAKAGNTNALKAIAALNEQGYTVTMGSATLGSATLGYDSYVGWGISDAFSLAMKPITLPAKYLWKGTKRVGRALGITHADANPEQVRMARLRAAQQRSRAAQARARAADAQSEAEYRAQQAFAAAADAEADAADAEATAKEAAMQTAEAEFLPGQTEATDADSSGATRPEITPLPDTPTPIAMQLKKTRRQVVAKKNPLAAKILAKSEENSPAGMKLAASMELYKKAQKRNSKERKAVAVMVAKAKKGDKQALADVQALKAAGIAVKADRKAAKHVSRAMAYRATTAKVKATQKRAEVAMSNQLIRRSRAHQLHKVAVIERKSAAGNKPCQLFVKKQVAKAKAGDKGAKKVVGALLLAKNARTTAPNRREQKKLKAAHRMVKQVAKGNKKALVQTRIIAAAAKHGNPNAKAAQKKLATAAAYESTLRTGMITLPAVVITSEIALKREKAKKAAERQKLASVETKLAAGKPVAREEIQAAAKAAADTGDKAKAAELMATAAEAPSAKEELARVATVAAAATAGNPRYQASIENASQLAAQGDSRGISAMGTLAGVKALDQVAKNQPLDPLMKEAVRDQEAAQTGNVVAAEKIATMQTQAAEKVPTAIKYMVAATGAAVVARALANNPVAQDEWKVKAGVKPATDENVAVEAEVVGPGPMSSLPDAPLPPVRGLWGLVKAALSAVALATRDPFQNYREGVASRGQRRLAAVDSAGSTLAPREQKILDSAIQSKTITEENYELLCSLETNPGETQKTLRKSGVKVVSLPRTKKTPDEEYQVHGDEIKIKTNSPLGQKIREDLRVMRKEQAEQDRQLPVDKKIDLSLLGDDDARQKLITDTKTRLSALVNRATAGDKKAQGQWQTAQANYKKNKDKASKGDAKAKEIVSILEATGLFTK